MIIDKVPSYYTEQQLRAYLKKAAYPGFELDSPLPEPTLDTLSKVVLQHLFTYPFENADMHYSQAHVMNVEPQALYQRFVGDGKGGSYCFGQNGLLLGMLRALGYPAYAAAARANELHMSDPHAPPRYSPLNHACLLVHPIDTPIHLVDTGFGGTGLIGPIELKHGATREGPAAEEHRILKGHPLNAATRDLSGWTVEWRGVDAPWRPLFQFSEAELYPNDYEALSFAFCGRADGCGPFWTDILCMRPFRAEDGTIGRMTMMNGAIKRRLNGKSEVMKQVTTEEERVEALKKYFDILITEEDSAFIQGHRAEIQAVQSVTV
ncbi:cysteine proteinase [Dacryopinax primogenitus]|uniref:Cysteine proteinase n=1 Tax=Dacryopinax primogenitus (strain DJM 731) TaxID=1858805 RepID=M5G7S9_DACPD|nr:cysteine proteinase [Dacryopinax primogenitus]EJU04809.1 cysteine proteinase [Dacryopinax primogenitus]